MEVHVEIHVAENGLSFGLDCQPTSSIEALQHVLAPVTGMPVHDQMLICGDTRLEPHRSLISYKLPAENRHIFLYNRCRLVADSPCPPQEEFETITVDVPPNPPPGSSASHPLAEASDPALKALPQYEILFKYHYQKGVAILSASQMRFDVCRRLLREQQVQESALETARGNMDYYYKIIDTAYSDFTKHYNRQHKQHSELLANLDMDLERLRSCKLHPGLRTQNHKTLLDYVKEGRVRKWADDCSISFKQFNAKVSDLKEVYAELKRNVQNLFYTAPAVNVRELAETIEESVCYTDEQASIIQSLSKDVNTVKKLVDDCVNSQFSASLRLHDAVSALMPMYAVHDKNHLPRIEACDRELGKLLDYCQKSKNTMTRCVHTRLQSVAALQSNLKDMRNQLAVFKEAMNRQEEIFSELKIVRRMGSAYKTCLAEVIRRKACMKLYMGQAGQLAEKLARKREAEVSRREEFLRVQSVYFSREVLEAMGLHDNPSQCVVNIAPFDKNLLELEIAELERYAPEALVGPVHKSDGRGVTGRSGTESGCRGVSETCPDAEGEDDGNSEDIGGTSKLEVENAWLKAELASAVARLCQVDPDFDYEEARDSDDLKSTKKCSHHVSTAAQKTAEALRLKDEYAKHLQGLLSTRQSQCSKYEARIRELEQRLSDQHLQMQKLSNAHGSADRREQGADSETSGVTALRSGGIPEPMDEVVNSLAVHEEAQHSNIDETGPETKLSSGVREGTDETMSDVSGGVSLLDAAMGEVLKEADGGGVERSAGVAKVVNLTKSFNEDVSGKSESPDVHPKPVSGCNGDKADTVIHLREMQEQIVVLQSALVEKTNECSGLEEKLKAAFADVGHARAELDNNVELLSECQMNCAHLENRLHEAREDARINLCAADRRATEYSALRASSVRLRGLMERLRTCMSSTVGAGFTESLHALAASISSSSLSDSGEDVEFRTSIRILAEKVGALAQQRAELLDRCTIAETHQSHLTKELENKNEALKTLYAKRKIDKQASKEMICFTRFQVHGLAVFFINSNGYYEALSRNCPNYFLSDESIDLFIENLPKEQPYIVGQIVHVDRNFVRSCTGPGETETSGGSQSALSSGSRLCYNPYSLPPGSEYFVVTVAMVPDFSPTLSL